MGILTKILKRDVALNSPKAWDASTWSLYGNQSKSGAQVNEFSALNYSAVYNAIALISGTIGALPLGLYRKTATGKEQLPENPLHVIVHRRPNGLLTSMQLRETLVAHLLGWGNCFAEIVRDKLGRVIELWPISPHRVTVERTSNVVSYAVDVGGRKQVLPKDRMLHIAGLGYDGITGYSVIAKARESIGLAMATEQFGSQYFGHGTHPGVIVSHPGKLGQDAHDNLKSSLVEKYSGLGNSHRLLLLEEGMTVESIGVPPNDSQFLETRAFSIIEIARWFNLPPHKLKSLDRATFSNIEHQSIEFVQDTILPWLVRVEQALDMQLLSDSDLNRGLYFKHSVEGLLRGDAAGRGAFYSQMFNIGALSINEIRAKEDLNPTENGDEHFVPLNMIPLLNGAAQMMTQDAPAPGPEVVDEARQAVELRAAAARDRIQAQYRPLIREAASRVINREGLAIKKQVKRSARDVKTLSEWLVKFYLSHGDYIERQMRPVFESLAKAIFVESNREIGQDPDKMNTAAAFRTFVEQYVNMYAMRHTQSSLGQLLSIIENDTDPETPVDDLVEQRVDEWEDTRPEKIAANETTRLSNASAQWVFFAAGLATVWRIRGAETCPYCKKLNGKKIRQGMSFVKAGESVEAQVDGETKKLKAYGLTMHPPLHQGCDCTIVAG